MAGGRTVVTWGIALAFGLALLGLGIYFFQLGLTQAAALATILGAFAGLLGVAVSVLALVSARSNTADPESGPRFYGSRVGTFINFERVRKVTVKHDRDE